VKGGIPKFCPRCRTKPVAWTNPRVDFCYGCLPGGPFTTPPCQRCMSTKDYYSAGLCVLCHPKAPQQPGSCKDCYAWGVVRKHKWLCWGCRSWRTKFEISTCTSCGREITVDSDSVCRLCWRQAASLRWTKTGLSLTDANCHGQQLFLANLHQRGKRAATVAPAVPRPTRFPLATPPRPVAHRQLTLVDPPRDLLAGKQAGFPPPSEPEIVGYLLDRMREHANQHGWSSKTIKRARRAIEILFALQDTPGAPIKTSVIHQLPTIELPAERIRDFLAQHRWVEDDRIPVIQTWFDNQVAGLPTQMITELRLWSTVLWEGHDTVPRSRARARNTVQIKLRWVLPTLRSWAAQGVHSLREVGRDEVIAALPASGNDRYTLGTGLRSVFTVLKAHKIVFINPTARLRLGAPERREPLPADRELIQQGLTSPDPTRAAMTALLAFHGLAPGELRTLLQTDIRDGRVHLNGRTILLAEPVRVRLAAYLNYRNQRWPHTANQHLFIHHRTALGTKAVGTRWPGLVLGTAARDIRTDRILDEVRATGGDLRRICALFGMSVAGATRYTAILDHPDLVQQQDPDH
jgi:hypothetical protein